MLGYFFYFFFLEKKSEFVAWKKGFSKGMLRNPSITFLTWILRTWPPRDRSPPTTPTNPMYGSLLRNCSFVNIKSYSTVWNFVLSSPLRFRHLYQCMNLKEYVVQHLTDSSLELEFRTPLFFSHLVPPAIMVCIFVWKYIFEPFIHILQHFVLQLSRSTNFCF